MLSTLLLLCLLLLPFRADAISTNPTPISLRHVARASVSAAASAAAVHLAAAGTFRARAAAPPPPLDRAAFYERFPYQKPSDIITYLDSLRLADGDADGLLRGMETFAGYYPMYALSRRKADILVGEVRRARPASVLEVGTFFGYSALSMASVAMRGAGAGRVTCVEANRDNAEVARWVLRKGLGAPAAGDSGVDAGPQGGVQVRIVEGISTAVLRSDALQGAAPFDLVFLDHDKATYVTDLVILEERGWLAPTCTVVADNVVFPGAPGYLEHVTRENGYDTRVVSAPFERVGFETQWKEVDDGMSVSIRVAS